MAFPDRDQRSKQALAGPAAVLARRYADALYDLAGENKVLKEVAADLATLDRLWQENADLRSLAAQPRLARAQLVKAMQNIAAAAALNPLTSNFLALIASNRRLSLLEAMIDAFCAKEAAQRGEATAVIRAARPLTQAQMEQLTTALRALSGGAVRLAVREDKSLIGGLTIRLGSRLIDGSLRGKLQRMERRLKSIPTTGAA